MLDFILTVFVVEQRALARSISDRTTDCSCSKGWSDRKFKYRLLLVGFWWTDVEKSPCLFRRTNVSQKGSVWSASFLIVNLIEFSIVFI